MTFLSTPHRRKADENGVQSNQAAEACILHVGYMHAYETVHKITKIGPGHKIQNAR